jgi:hypothetical protein
MEHSPNLYIGNLELECPSYSSTMLKLSVEFHSISLVCKTKTVKLFTNVPFFRRICKIQQPCAKKISLTEGWNIQRNKSMRRISISYVKTSSLITYIYIYYIYIMQFSVQILIKNTVYLNDINCITISQRRAETH